MLLMGREGGDGGIKIERWRGKRKKSYIKEENKIKCFLFIILIENKKFGNLHGFGVYIHTDREESKMSQIGRDVFRGCHLSTLILSVSGCKTEVRKVGAFER